MKGNKMTTLEELKKQQEQLAKDIAALEKGDIKKRDEYWFIGDYGNDELSWWDDCPADHYRRNTGNFYRSESDRDKALEIIKKIIELRDGWLLDYKDKQQEKWSVYYDVEAGLWCFVKDRIPAIGSICLPTKEAAKEIVKYGDDLLLVAGRI